MTNILRFVDDNPLRQAVEWHLDSPSRKKSNAWNKYVEFSEDEPNMGRTQFYNVFPTLVDPVEEAYRKQGPAAGARVAKEINQLFVVDGIYSLAQMDALHTPIALCHPRRNQYIGPPIEYFSISVKHRGMLGHVIDPPGFGERTAMFIELLKQALLPKTLLAERYGMDCVNPFYGMHGICQSDGTSALCNAEVLRFINAFLLSLVVNSSGKPWKNAFIERFHYSYVTLFVSELPGYLPPSEGYGDGKKNLNRVAVLDPFEYEVIASRFSHETYNHRPHKGLFKVSPVESLRKERESALGRHPALDPSLPFRGDEIADYAVPLHRKSRLQTGLGVQIDNRIYGSKDTTTAIERHLKSHRKPLDVQSYVNYGNFGGIKIADPRTAGSMIEVPFKRYAHGIDESERWDLGVSTLREERIQELSELESGEIIDRAKHRKKQYETARKRQQKQNTPAPVSLSEITLDHAEIAFASQIHSSILPEEYETPIPPGVEQPDVPADDVDLEAERELVTVA